MSADAAMKERKPQLSASTSQPCNSGAGRSSTADGTRNPALLLSSDRQNSESSDEPWPISSTWRWRILGELAEVKLGKMLDKAKHTSGHRLPYLRNVNVRWGAVDTSDLLEMNFDEGQLERFGLKANDVLVCEGGEPGRASVWNGRMPNVKFQKALHRVRFNVPYEPRMLVYFLELLAKSGRLERRFTGSTIKHLTREAFIRLPVPLPPADEQRQIVAEIEKQFTRLDAGVAALRRVQANLKRYRAAVLKAACEGRLVPTELNLWRQMSLAELLRSEDIFNDGDWVESKDQDPNGEVRLIQLADVGDGTFRNRSNRFLTKVKAIELGCTFLKRGDILIARMPDPLGRACIFPGVEQESVTVVDVCIIRSLQHHYDSRWLMYAINSSDIRAQVSALQAGSTRKRISRKNLSTIRLRVPPLVEQTLIVAEVERRLSVIEELEGTVAANLQRSIRLRQSILRRAFSAA